MKLYRYELYCEDEPQDVGFLVGLEDLGLSAESEHHLMAPFDDYLKIPDSPAMRGSVSFFTETGNTHFQASIAQVAAAYQDSIFDIMLCTLDLPDHALPAVVYQDEYQICLPAELYRVALDPLVSRSEFSIEDPAQGPFQIRPPALIGNIYHVGTMDITKKSPYSHEWNGLSISNCPDAWRRINRGVTSGDCFLLSKPDMKLLDYYALTDSEKEQIQTWAIENGYVSEGTLYKSITWDEEDHEWFSLYDSYEDALCEADDEEERVQPAPGLLPTQKLLDQALVKVELLDVPDIITALYAEQVLGYDGMYWDDMLDIPAYSAPRGVIFNSRLNTFEAVNLTKEQAKKPSLDSVILGAASRCSGSAHSGNQKGREPDPMKGDNQYDFKGNRS